MEVKKLSNNDSHTDYAYNIIKDISEKFGPRYSSSEAEKNANLWIKEEFSKYCDETHLEEFQTNPNLYPQGIFKVTGFFAGIAFIFMPLIFPFPILSAIFIALGLFILFSELMFMKRWIKFLFKKGISSNVYGIIRPTGEVKYRVLFEGHMDSAKQMRIAEREGDAPVKIFILGFIYLFYTLAFSIIKFIIQLLMGNAIPELYRYGIIQLTIIDLFYFVPWLVLYPCFLYLLRGFTGNTVVPGAADNLSGVAVTAVIGKYLSENRPKNVEIIIASMGSEEIGDRGAKYFVENHGDLLENCYSFIIDDAGAGNKLYFIEKDFMHRTTYSPEVITRMEQAAELYKKEKPDAATYGKRKIPLGSSDACMYIKGGYKASFMVGVQESESGNKKISKPPHWHSVRDTWQNISKKMLKSSIGIALKFVEIVDKEFD
jgi:hypothetical protein